jgi:transcriptional regulator with XRE-family HTH domain
MPGSRAKTRGRDPIDVHVGARLRRRRMTLKLTPRQLARRLGLTAEAVQRYESGEQPIAAADLWRMAKAMGVRMEYFARGLPKPSIPKRVREIDAIAQRVVKPLMALPPFYRAAMMRHIRELARERSADG